MLSFLLTLNRFKGFSNLLQKLAATLDYAKPTDWWSKKGCEPGWLECYGDEWPAAGRYNAQPGTGPWVSPVS